MTTPPIDPCGRGTPSVTHAPISSAEPPARRPRPAATPLWLWGLAAAVLILCAARLYMRYGESGRPGEILARTADRLQHGSDCSRARAMLELVADGDLSLDERRLLVRLFDDNQPEELHHLAVVLLATHYRLRAAPAAPTDIQVFGQGSPAVIRYPGGYPSYLEFNEKYDLQVQIAQRIAADEGRPVQAAPPRLPPSVQPPRPPAPKK